MRQEHLAKSALARRGAAALQAWVGDLVPDREALLVEVRARYWLSVAEVAWPRRRALQLHLVFSALPGAALYGTLRERGWEQDRAIDAVAEVLANRAARHRVRLERLTRVRVLRAAFLPAARLATRVGFPPPGWETRWRERSATVVAFDMTRCFLLDTFTQLGVPEMTRAYCAVDDQLYGDLCPQLRWLRTGTLATGAPACDFRFERAEDVRAR